MSEFWNQRYAAEHYVYGREPNAFFKSVIDSHAGGKLLLPGEGEGRNAVYAARMGWDVHAFDLSEIGRQKAMMLAREHKVNIDYRLSSLLDYPHERETFDLIALIFFHIMPEARRLYHSLLVSALKPGGMLVMEAFSKKQLNNDSGGPKDITMLYSEEELADDFRELRIEMNSAERIKLDEGPHHQGLADVIRFTGRKMP